MIKFIKKLQNSDEATKKLWLVVLSATTMIIVVGLWLIYTKSTLVRLEPSTQTPEKSLVQTESNNAVSVKDTLLAGLKLVGSKIKAAASAQNHFTVTPMDKNFVVEDLNPIPKTTLP